MADKPTDLFGYGEKVTEILGSFIKRTKQAEPERRGSSTEQLDMPGFAWLDYQNPTKRAMADLRAKHELFKAHTDRVFSRENLPEVSVEEGYIYVLFNFSHETKRTKMVETHQLVVFLGKDWLVTVHDDQSGAVRKFLAAVRESEDSKNHSSPARLLLNLITELLSETNALVDQINVDLDKIEAKVFENHDSDARRISILRRRIVRIRRNLSSQKRVLEDLDDVIDKFSGERLNRFYTANTNLSVRLWESLEDARETVEIYKDADFISSQEQNNRILAILTLIFTLAIPVTLVASIYGMNVNLPGGVETGNWEFWGPYTTFMVSIGSSLVIAIAMFIYFKRKHWF